MNLRGPTFLLSGWQYLLVDYQNGGFLYGTHMNGLIVGFNLRCKYKEIVGEGCR